MLKDSNAVNVSEQFKIVFRTGAIIIGSILILLLLNSIQVIKERKFLKLTCRILLSIAVLVYFCHFIASNIIRFNKTGSVCSGDFCEFLEEKQLYNITQQCLGIDQYRIKGPIYYDSLEGKFLKTMIYS